MSNRQVCYPKLTINSNENVINISRLPGPTSTSGQERQHSSPLLTRNLSRTEMPNMDSMVVTQMPSTPQRNLVTITLDIDNGTVEFVKGFGNDPQVLQS